MQRKKPKPREDYLSKERDNFMINADICHGCKKVKPVNADRLCKKCVKMRLKLNKGNT